MWRHFGNVPYGSVEHGQMNIVVAVAVTVIGYGDFAGIVRGDGRVPAILTLRAFQHRLLHPRTPIIHAENPYSPLAVDPGLASEPRRSGLVGASNRVNVGAGLVGNALFR